MADPVTYPWVNFLMSPTRDINSTESLVFGSDKGCIIDSIWVCNTSDTDSYITLKIKTAGRETVDDFVFLKDKVLNPANVEEILKGSVLYMQPGDLIHASTSYDSDRFDCFVSYRKLNELEGA